MVKGGEGRGGVHILRHHEGGVEAVKTIHVLIRFRLFRSGDR